ncbi:MAG TPA: phosphoglucosamine mutase [Abditibacteriaceae bacterium]
MTVSHKDAQHGGAQPNGAQADHASALMISVSGIRGVVGQALSPGNALDFVQAYAAWLKNKGIEQPRVLVARDTRPSGQMMLHAVLAGLIGSGCKIIDLGIVATPTLQLAIPHLKADGAICITASHNPIEWNALKFFQPSGMYLDKEMGGEVIRLYHAKEFVCGSWDQMGTVEYDDTATQLHVNRVLEIVDADLIRSKKYKVVLDGCCGAGNVVSPILLRQLGCELIHINSDLSGIFPHNPEPLNENMVQLCDAVRQHGADIGFAHDADADRVAIVTDAAQPIGEDYSLVWAVAHVLKNRRQGPVVTNLSTSLAVESVAREHGCELIRTPVGDINVSGTMRQVDAAIGGEGNGGVIIPDIQYGRDGIAAIALTLEFLAKSEMRASEIAASLPHPVILKTTLDFPKERMGALLSWLKSKEKTARIDERDGLRFDWPRDGVTTSWAHVRPSGTEPFVRLICEAQTAAEAQRIQKTMRAEIESIAGAW